MLLFILEGTTIILIQFNALSSSSQGKNQNKYVAAAT